MHYLVVDNHRSKLLSFAEQYRLFTSKDAALEHATNCGFEDDFGIGVSDQSGRATQYKCGDVDVTILPLELV